MYILKNFFCLACDFLYNFACSLFLFIYIVYLGQNTNIGNQPHYFKICNYIIFFLFIFYHIETVFAFQTKH